MSIITELRPSVYRHRALIVNGERKYELVDRFETTAYLGPHEVKIRTCAVGLNQIDYKSVDYNFCLPAFPWITGREMAGVVEEVGSAVHHTRVGEKVWTCKLRCETARTRDLTVACSHILP